MTQVPLRCHRTRRCSCIQSDPPSTQPHSIYHAGYHHKFGSNLALAESPCYHAIRDISETLLYPYFCLHLVLDMAQATISANRDISIYMPELVNSCISVLDSTQKVHNDWCHVVTTLTYGTLMGEERQCKDLKMMLSPLFRKGSRQSNLLGILSWVVVSCSHVDLSY